MDTPLGKGIFLVAKPSLRDPNFRQTVILLCEYGPDGSLGVVINRPTEISITEVLPQVPILESQRHRVFSGGPVQRNNLLILYRMPDGPEDTHHVFDGVYLGGNMEALKRIVEDPQSSNNFQAFMGYSGWAPGQLENEMETGSWITLPADTTMVFETKQSELWPEILRSLGTQYAMYAEMPPDPQMN
ncbi:MAG: YqgE/AlgH family protein [Nitrospirota bacterium]|nr:YqgE/AlgH family protein [Nitrospirota bacterium]